MKFVDDILLIAGIGFIAAGAALVYIPAGLVVIGVGLIGLAYLATRRRLNVTR